MFLDDLLKLADAQTDTLNTASTSYIDTQASGDSYEGAWFYIRVDTAFVAYAGTPYAKWELQTSPSTNFTDAGTATLIATATVNTATCVAGYEVKVRVPAGAKRYIRGYFAPEDPTGVAIISGNATNAFSTAVYDMFLVKDVDINRNLA